MSVTARRSNRERKVTERLEIDPNKKSYSNKVEETSSTSEDNHPVTINQHPDIPNMAPRRCKAEGCTYVVGEDGDIPEGAAG